MSILPETTAAPVWPIHVINMAANTVRMTECAQALTAFGLRFQRFEAVNGRALSNTDIAEVYDAVANRTAFRHPLLAGEIGCYLSHIAVWRLIAAGDAAGAVVLEDDFEADAGLAGVLAGLAADRDDWDMVKLYSRRPGARMLDRRALLPGIDLGCPYQVPNTTLGYVLRKDAAVRLLAWSVPFARPIDEDHKRVWDHGLDIRLVLPPPLTVRASAQGGDTIAAARRGTGRSWRQMVRNLGYRLRYLAALHGHRLSGR